MIPSLSPFGSLGLSPIHEVIWYLFNGNALTKMAAAH
jgi:hypothetical protein